MSDQAAPQDLVPVLGHVDDYLRFCMQYDASDLHIATAAQPIWRRFGNLTPIWSNSVQLTPEDTRRLAYSFLTESQIHQLETKGDVDFAYSPDYGRFRASVIQQRLGIDITFRIITTNIRSVDELGLPDTVRTLIRYHNGLVLVTGPVGCGKSTTLAALVDEINKERQDHIITLEDPIEYVVEPKSCHVNQREVGTHTDSFAAALRGALREDPDVIMVGEMRDLETISLALTAAETGLLVFGTLHTNNARKTVDRIIDVFPADQQSQVRTMLAASLKGVVAQLLMKKADGKGRVAVNEIMVSTPAVGAIIREGATQKLYDVIIGGKAQGMQFMDDSIWQKLRDGYASPMEAYMKAIDKGRFKAFLPPEDQAIANAGGGDSKK